MLLVLYGGTAEVGFKSRDYLVKAGFELIEKLNCASDHVIVSTRFGKRNWVSKEDFYNQTDSLFRYTIGGIHVGFNQDQILDAVSNNANKLLTLSSPDISLLKEIKQVYGDTVRIIYCYIDENTLKNLVSSFNDIQQEEAEFRLEAGKTLRQQYAMHSDLFDYVVIYNGENSEFDMEHLFLQYKAIIDSIPKIEKNEKYDVFLSYASRDSFIVGAISQILKNHNIKVFYDDFTFLGTDYLDSIKNVISNSKVVVPIITKSAIKSDWVKREINESLKIAEDSAVVVVPFFLDLDIDLETSFEFSILSGMHGIICEDRNVVDAGERLAQTIKRLLNGLDRLELYSEQVNNYYHIKEYKKAFDIQKEHRNLCIELFNFSNGKYVGMDVIINSEIKLINLLIDMESWNEALAEVIETLKELNDDTSPDAYVALKELFAVCCVGCNYNEDDVAALIKKELDLNSVQLKDLGKRINFFNHDLCEDLINEFRIKNTKNNKEKIREGQENIGEEKTLEIAQHGEAAMRLFDALFDSKLTEQTRVSMIEGYQRVLNYCLQLGLSEQISSECIRKIAELKENESVVNDENQSAASALRVFLGQAAPGSGNYDIFLSFKSEDEALARKVYEFLRQNGKETFFSKESLPQLGESEYEDAIYEALDKSKHLVLVASNPEYFKTDWVSREWKFFNNKNRESDKKGNIVMILPKEYVKRKDKLPHQLRYDFEIIEISDFKNRLLSYLR